MISVAAPAIWRDLAVMGRQTASVPVDATFYTSHTGPRNSHHLTGLTGYSDANRHGHFSVILHEFADNLYGDGHIERPGPRSVRCRHINSIRQATPGGARDYPIRVRKGGQ
jgi:hypothetical protein